MAGKKKKREALTVTRLINEVLVSQLSIPLRQIVNDTSFERYTGSRRPDLLISEVEFAGGNEEQFIANLVAYAEVKDNCSVDDNDWNDAIKQGKNKSKKINLPYFIVTNCKKSIFYNSQTLERITLNKSPIYEFQTIDILRLIKNRLASDPTLKNIRTNVDSISTISEAIFNKKLWELETVYRGVNLKTDQQIDFTIGFISLEFFEEKEVLENKKDYSLIYWSECIDDNSEKLVANLSKYITRLEKETDFKEFKNLMEIVKTAIESFIDKEDVRAIYEIIDSMKPLHGTGFDLFGAVYEKFASSKEKKDFGQYFTRRNYAHILSKLLLKNESCFDDGKKFKILDPACGTGGFLTESFKILKNNYESSETLSSDAKEFLEKRCFYGIDVRDDNISRTKLNMFLVGDGHTNMFPADTLKYKFNYDEYNYIITNPPYGDGTIKAEASYITTSRTEIAFLSKIIKLLKMGTGRACVITPDGVLENPTYKGFRLELLETCNINAIISLPKFAFAPYTKEKTYALFFEKKTKKTKEYSENNDKVRIEQIAVQKEPIWMYIIDNDGLANSDKRFPTKLRNQKNGWMHDEIAGWVNTFGEEMPGLLEERWLKYDDSKINGTEWINEKGIKVKMRKAEWINIERIKNDKYLTLLPEYYLRPYEPNYIDLETLRRELQLMKEEIDFLGAIISET